VWCGEGGLSFALEHSKVCTLCDFGHLQFLFLFFGGWASLALEHSKVK
jgi:hypothetical protein